MPKSKFDIDIVCSNIKMLIRKKNITQNHLAEEIGMSGSALSKRMSGTNEFTLNEIFDIAQYFNVSIDALCNNSLAATLETEPHDKVYSKDGKLSLHSNTAIYRVCEGLASVFKYSTRLFVEPLQRTEIVYEEDTDQHGRPTGWFYEKKDPLGNDPTNEYNAIYFSNYLPIYDGPFEPEVDPEDYYSDLIHNGNYIFSNYKINRFLKKLVDLHTTYENKSLKYDDYCRSIDNLLAELPKTDPPKYSPTQYE